MARFVRGPEETVLDIDHTRLVETSAMTAARTLHDARAARIAYYLRTGELLDAGWHRTSRFVDDLLEDDALPFAIEDDGARDVYRDWLIERGDPRGELAALRAAATPGAAGDTRAISSLEKTRGVELFGLFAMLPRLWRDHVAFGWRQGWIDEIVLQYPTRAIPVHELLHAALHAPMARFARTLTLDIAEDVALAEIRPCACLDQLAIRSQD